MACPIAPFCCHTRLDACFRALHPSVMIMVSDPSHLLLNTNGFIADAVGFCFATLAHTPCLGLAAV